MKSSCFHRVVALCALLLGIFEHVVLAVPVDGLSIFVTTGKPPMNTLENSSELVISGDRWEGRVPRSMIDRENFMRARTV